MKLPRYHIYTSFQSGGRSTGWLSGQTLPPPEPIRDVAELRTKSMLTYGKPAEEIEAEYLTQLGYNETDPPENPVTDHDSSPQATPPAASGGRRKISPTDV